jgi:hypothetical protein
MMLDCLARKSLKSFGPYSPIQPGKPTHTGDHDRVSHTPVKPRSPPHTQKSMEKPSRKARNREINEIKGITTPILGRVVFQGIASRRRWTLTAV